MSNIKYGESNIERGIAGQIATTEATNIKSVGASWDIYFGKAVAASKTHAGDFGKNFYRSKAVITFSADFTASTTVDLKVNGTAITTVTTVGTPATDMTAIVNAISTLIGITATYTGNDVTVTVDNALDNCIISDITLTGGTPPTSTVTYSTEDTFEGIAKFTHKVQSERAGNGEDFYEDKTMIGIVTKGVIWVEVTADVTYGEAVYVNTDFAGSQGSFTSLSTNNLLVAGARFRDTVTGGTLTTPKLAKIEINQPN